MSCSKPLPPYLCDLLYYFNRDQLERSSVVCRRLKNFIDRYFQSKPRRVFDELWIRGGLYALCHKEEIQWHPNRDDYSIQQFLARQKCSIDKSRPEHDRAYYSFAEMRPYLCPTVCIKLIAVYVAGDSTYNSDHIAEMESISYLWRDGEITIRNAEDCCNPIRAEDFQPILNSPTILQCRHLEMYKAHFSFKDYQILYTTKIFELLYEDDLIDPKDWLQFLEQPKTKPIVVFQTLCRVNIDNLFDRLFKAFSSALSPNAFKIVFAQCMQPLIEFRETNKTSSEILELKKGLPEGYQEEYLEDLDNYTLERSNI